MRRMFFKLAAVGALLTVLVSGRAFAQDAHDAKDNPTAYTALRLVGKTLGADAINRVVELTGRDGVPQPTSWKIVLKEGDGSREVEVVNGQIEAQRPLSRAVATPPIKLQDLNLDSSGALDVTDAQARKAKVRFDSVNYALRTSEKTGKPLWTLELFGPDKASAGTMRIAANTGAVVSQEGRIAGSAEPAAPKVASTEKPPGKASPSPAKATPRPVGTPKPSVADAERPAPSPRKETKSTTLVTTTTTNAPVAPPAAVVVDVPDAESSNPPPPSDGSGGFFTRAGRTLDHTSHAVGQSLDHANQDVNHHLRRAGATVQRFFTGHRDLNDDGHPAAPLPDAQPD